VPPTRGGDELWKMAETLIDQIGKAELSNWDEIINPP
jgi:hypothetical protein